MEDIARLGMVVDSSGLLNAKKRLDDLPPAARKAESATERFSRSMAAMNGEIGALGGVIGRASSMLKAFAAGFAGAFSVGMVAKLSDEYTSLTNTLKVVAGEQGNVNQLLAQLNGIAERTRAPIGATAQLYQRMAIAAGELGASQGQLLRFTENIGLALAQQGGSAEAASGALFQLSQAMGSSVVRAEEFNSIVEGAYPIALAAAKGIDEAGGSVAKLRGMMLEGRLTSKTFFDAILSQTDDLEAAFAQTTPTISQAFGRLREELMLSVGGFNDFTGASSGVAMAITAIANNMNSVVAVLGGVTAAIVAAYVPAVYSAVAAMATWAGSFVLLHGGIMGAIVALVTMRGALLATGVGAFAVGIGLAIKAVLDLSDELGGLTNVWRLVVMVATDTWDRIAAGGSWLVAKLSAFWQSIAINFHSMINGLRRMWGSFVNDVANGMSKLPFMGDAAASVWGMGFEIEGQAQMADAALGRMQSELGKTGEAAAAAWKRMTTAPNIGNMKLAIKGLVDTAEDAGEAITTNVVPSVDSLGSSLGRAGGAAAAAVEKLSELEQLTEGFTKLSEPFDQASRAFDALDKLKENGIISNDQFAGSLGRIEEAFLRAGGSAEQWANIVKDQTKGVAEQLDELGKKNLNDLGTSFIDLAVDGKASFADLTKSIIKDLLAMAWQAMVVKPLLSFMGIPMAAQGAVATPDGAQFFAKGGAFTDQVFNQPAAFKFAQGGGFSLGVMGEAGPEAVMPLTRGPDGSLGVQMYGEAASGRVSGAQAGTAQPAVVNIGVRAGELFEPYVEGVAGDVAVSITHQAMNDMNAQLPERVNQILDDPKVR